VKLSGGAVLAIVLTIGVIVVCIYFAVHRAYDQGRKDAEAVKVIEQQKERAMQERSEGDAILREARALSKSSIGLKERLRTNAEQIEKIRETRGDLSDVAELDQRFDALGY